LKKENSRKDDAANLKKENSRKDNAANLKKENSRKDNAANLKKENSRKDDAANLKQARVALVQISRGSLKKAKYFSFIKISIQLLSARGN